MLGIFRNKDKFSVNNSATTTENLKLLKECPETKDQSHKKDEIIDNLLPAAECISELTKSQIYFDFVPPPMNTFEYLMSGFLGVENSLFEQYQIQDLLPRLSEYMSFTFVYGNHKDLKHASLALFDAEPEEKLSEDNVGGIVIVFLDEDITFEMLKNMIKNTNKLEIKGEEIILAVHSDQLLRDHCELKSILEPLLGGERHMHVLDAKRKLHNLYESFSKVLCKAEKNLEKRMHDLRICYGNDNTLLKIEERFDRLCKINTEKNEDETCGTNKQATYSSVPSRLQTLGLKAYTIENNTLILCFHTNLENIEDMIPIETKQTFSNIRIIHLTEPLFTYQNVKGGDKLNPYQHNADKYGTLGMFGSFCQSGQTTHRCCISSPHVISSRNTAYIQNGDVTLGDCFWPPAVDDNCINVEDISIICIDSQNIKIKPNVEGKISLFNGDISQLKRRKVKKIGATTYETTGFIRDPEFILMLGNSIKTFLIEPEAAGNENSRFSKPGDSGAIVFTKFGQNVVVLSMIFGGEVNVPGIAQNNTIAVDLKQALKRFKDNNPNIALRLDTLLQTLGLKAYTIENNTLILCFHTNLENIEDMIPIETKQTFSNIRIIHLTEPLFTYQNVKGGDKLHPHQHKADKYGTLGMFGSFCQSDQTTYRCCIHVSSPHVISSGNTAYIQNGDVTLGDCFWPPAVDDNCINVEDISVICIDSQDIKIKPQLEGEISLFNSDISQLKRRKVKKIGATTYETTGFIQDPEFVLMLGNWIKTFLIEPEAAGNENSRFSKPGDSGAIVFTKFGQNVVGLSMLFGGEVNVPGIAQNNTIAVDLKPALQRFKDNNPNIALRLDTL